MPEWFIRAAFALHSAAGYLRRGLRRARGETTAAHPIKPDIAERCPDKT
jgi:hypothetical protein